MLGETPSDKLIDAEGRPYFLWDCDLTMQQLRSELVGADPTTRAYWVGKVMRQAKPEDALALIPAAQMADQWDAVERHLGERRAFWTWLLTRWGLRCSAA